MTNNRSLRRPDNAKKFPGAKVGDVLYHGGLEEGIRKLVVIHVSLDDFVLVVDEVIDPDDLTGDSMNIWWAVDGCFLTVAEVVSDWAKWELGYCTPRVKIARRVLKVVEKGGDLSEFVNGIDFDIIDPESDGE